MFQGESLLRDHIHVKARLLSEGVRVLGEEPAATVAVPSTPRVDVDDVEAVLRVYADTLRARERTPIKEMGNVMRFDESGVVAPIIPAPHSRLELRRDGEHVTVSDGDRQLISGCIPPTPAWTTKTLSNGLPVMSVLPLMSEGMINVVFSLSCINYNTGRGCKYCNLFANPVAKQLAMLPMKSLEGYAKYQAEAVKIATDAGWRGTLAFSGGALAPSQRPEYLDRIAVVMGALRDAVGAEVLESLPKIYNHYPPEDLADMRRLRDEGITGTSIDLEVMDPAYFAAVCPGKHAYRPLAFWKKAQEVSVDVFGPYANTTGFVIVGLEPMDSLVEGMKERLSRGVLPLPFVFYTAPGSAYWGFRPPTAEWLVETTERLADVLMPHVPRIMQTLAASNALVPAAPSFANGMLFDEMQRRIQELMSGGRPAATSPREARPQGMV